jgi:hypothetical protein
MTPTLPIVTAACAALIGLLAAFLTVRVILNRVRFKCDTGDGGHAALAQAIRAHGNLTEHAPLALLLIGFAEALHAPLAAIYLLGGALVLARLASAWGLSHSLELGSSTRKSGAGLTVLVIVVSSLLILYTLATR